MADYIFDFTLTGNKYYNGKVLQVSSTNLSNKCYHPWVMSESIVKADFELAVRGVNFMNILLLKRKDILRVNSFAFYNFGSSKCLEAKRLKTDSFINYALCKRM
jgi:hypothetical protein